MEIVRRFEAMEAMRPETVHVGDAAHWEMEQTEGVFVEQVIVLTGSLIRGGSRPARAEVDDF